VLIFSSPLIVASLQQRGEVFFALAVLDEEGMTDHYYPDDNSEIEVDEKVLWNLYLHNKMGDIQYVAVRAKLINSATTAPNSSTCSSSSGSLFYEVRQVLQNDETWVYPFSWFISDIQNVGNKVEIIELSVNGNSYEVKAEAGDGNIFRMIFELWVYDSETDDFQFGWNSGDESYCAWTQIWFNATLPGV
jgi:hypothetical protein